MTEQGRTLEQSFCREVGRRCTCYNLRKAARAVTRLYDEVLRPSGLRATQYSVLMAAYLRGPITLKKLAEVTMTERTTITRNIRVLERKELIRIEQGSDRRERQIRITERGHEALRSAVPLWEKAQERVEMVLGSERMEKFLQDLAEIGSLLRRE